MRLFRWFIVRQIRREPLRSAATAAGVALGVAVVIAIRFANASSVRGFEAALDAVSGRTSLEIAAPGAGMDEMRLADLGWLRDYGRVSPVIDRDVVIQPRAVRDTTGEPTGELVRLLGIDILRDRPFREYRLLEDGAPRPITTDAFLTLLIHPRAVVLTRAFADRHGLTTGDEVALVAGDRIVALVIAGLLDATGPGATEGGQIALMDIAAAQDALDLWGRIDRADVQLRDGVDVAVAEREIGERLPDGLAVRRPARRGAEVERMLAAFHFNLNALSSIALLVGLFLVYNTVSVSVITRRPEIGMLRTVGASRRTVLGLFLGEAVLLAAVGCLVGAPLGWLLAENAVRLTASTVRVFWVATAAVVPTLTPADIALAFALAVALALVAAAIPALEAARLAPVAAVRNDTDLAMRARLPRRYPVGAAVLFAIGAWLASRPAVDGLPVFGFLAGLAVIFGAALVVPVALHLVPRAGRLFTRWLGVAALLAQSSLAGSVRRLGVSVAALAVSLAMMVAVAVMIGSFRETVSYWVTETLAADLFVSTGRQSPVGDRPGISIEAETLIREHPDVAAVDGFRGVDVPYGESRIVVGSGRFDVAATRGRLLFKAPADGRSALTAAVGQPAAVVSEPFANRYGAAVGDTIVLPTPVGDRPVRITGVYYDYSNDRGSAIMDEATFREYYGPERPASLTLYLRPGADANRVRDEILASLGPTRTLFINTNASLRRQVLDIFDSTFAITYALEGIAILVSMIGVASTLITVALERRRDIAMLRLVGAGRRQLRQMIMIEAGLIGLVSQAIGLGAGLVLSLILIYVINVQSFGWTIQFHLPGVFLAQSSVLILVATVLSGLYPARLAGRFSLGDLSSDA